jgi:APA family basic amino acid/polyamine antiporter
LNLVILVTPRVLQAMAADGVFFQRFAILHPVYQTPTAAIVALASFAVVLTLTGTFAQLVDYVTFGDWIFFGATVAGLYVYRARDPVRRYPITPALFVLAAGFVVYSVVVSNPKNAAMGAGHRAGHSSFLYWRANDSHPSATQQACGLPVSCNTAAQRQFEPP